jgi:hypothetical protein
MVAAIIWNGNIVKAFSNAIWSPLFYFEGKIRLVIRGACHSPPGSRVAVWPVVVRGLNDGRKITFAGKIYKMFYQGSLKRFFYQLESSEE